MLTDFLKNTNYKVAFISLVFLISLIALGRAESIDTVAYPEDKVAYLFDGGEGIGVAELINPTKTVGEDLYLSNCGLFTCSLYVAFTPVADLDTEKYPITGTANSPIASSGGVKVYDVWTTTVKEPIYSTTEKYYELTEVDNKTGVNSTVKVYYNETTVTGYKDVEKEVAGYVPLEGTLGAGKTYLLRFDYTRAEMKPVDLIPQFGEEESGKLELWAWWNNTFNYKTCLNATIVSNQTLLPIVDLNETNTNGTDIRVVWENGTTELNFWREVENRNTSKNWNFSTASGYIWANTTAIQGTNRTQAEICIYYNASSPVSDLSSGARTFAFFDYGSSDYSDRTNGTQGAFAGIVDNAGNPMYYLKATSGAVGEIAIFRFNNSPNFESFILELDIYINTTTANWDNMVGTGGVSESATLTNFTEALFYEDGRMGYGDGNSFAFCSTTDVGNFYAQTWYSTKLNTSGGNFTSVINGSQKTCAITTNKKGDIVLELWGHTVPQQAYYDNIRLYENTPTSPTFGTWGAEQQISISSSITFISQTPTNLTNSNIFASTLQISYNATSDLNNNSLMLLHYKTNNSLSDCLFITNGTATCGYSSKTGTNVSTVWNFTLGDNAVYPATYNINETYMEATGHSSGTITNRNQYFRVELLNVSNTSQYNMFEVYMQNQTAGTTGAEVYYCNSTYSTGSPANDSNCALIYTQAGFSSFNHSHSVNSKHLVIPMLINTTSGSVQSVKVTANSSFLVRGPQTGTWEYYYIADVSRATASRTSSNGGVTWSNLAGTIDSHLHQFYGNETFYYYASYNETTNSTLNSNTLNLTHIPPTSPQITVPTNNTYFNNTLNITYLSSFAPDTPATNISYYSLYLVDVNEVAVKTLTTNNSLNLFYAWDTTTTTEGQYRVKVIATDTGGYTSYAMSVPFIINPRANSNAVPGYPSDGQNFTIAPGTAITMNATLTPNIWNYCTINYTNGTITTVNSTFPYCNATISSPSNTTYTWNATFFDDFGTNKTSATYTFNVSYTVFTINNYTYTTPQYETVAYSRTINFSLPSNESLNSAVVEYNSVNFSATCTNVSTTYYCELTNTPAPPITTNGTVKTSTWYINYTNAGSTAVNTQSYNTTILFGAWPTAIISDEEIAMESNVEVNLSYSNVSGFLSLTATLGASANVGSNSGTLTCSGGLCTGDVVAPTVTKNTIYQVGANYTITSPFWGTSVTRNVSLESNAGREASTLQAYSGLCTSPSNFNDSSWVSYTTAGTSCVLYENYTMTQMANTTAWRVKDTSVGSPRDLTIPEDCWGSTLQFKVLRNSTLAQYYCWNYTTDSFVMLNSYSFVTNYYLYEENLTTANWYNNSYVRVVPYGLSISCATGSILLTYICKDEDTKATITCNYEQLFTLTLDTGGSTDYSFNGTDTTWDVCIVPSTLNGTVDSIEKYDGTGYSSRDYFLFDVETSGKPYNKTIYLGASADTQLTYIYVKRAGIKVSGAYVYVQKHYLGNNTFENVAMVKTDTSDGKGNTYLVPNTIWYRFVVVEDGDTVYTSETQHVACSPSASYCTVVLNIESSSIDFWDYKNGIASQCNFTNSTKIVACTFTNLDGTDKTFEFYVYNFSDGDMEEEYSGSTTTASGTLFFDLGDANTTGQYSYYLVVDDYTLQSGAVDLNEATNWGEDSPILALLIILTLAFAFSVAGPTMMVLGAYFGLVISWLFNFINLGDNSITIIGGMGIVVGVLIYAFKR